MQNLLAFRFSNGMFEPLWNKNHIDHIQFTVAESVGVEGRGGYYDSVGRAARHDPEPHVPDARLPVHGAAVVVRAPTRSATRRRRCSRRCASCTPEDVLRDTVRGQYGPGRKPDGTPVPGYRQEPDVAPDSATETFAALQALHRQLALGRRADLPALGQEPVEARHRDRRPVQEGARGAVSRGPRRRQPGAQPAHLPHPAGPGHRAALPGQAPRPAAVAAEGQHALRLPGGVRGLAQHRLRGAALPLHARRRDAVLAQRPGRGGLAHRPADPRHLGRQPAARLPELRGRHLGPEGRVST